ncbi:bifunctional metallophosphatase/5'-nucleotidase [Methanolacinia paynteri]|uniref:bifunctional metallophosphatase/5'-nucleotidase n=1 Tax=Methanolacinia paynteri TaxID=230356 RepID=UPI00064F0FA4|nr:bifunctional UDP-sugar hydrolase/5'-nucleotidase [Methanolacinia paynteri]
MQKSSGLKSVIVVTFVLVIVAVFLSSFVPGVAFNGNTGSSGSGYSGDLRVLTTPDIHSHLFPMSDNDTGTRIGRIAALAGTLGEENDDTLYLFAGDLGEGGFYNMYSGVPEAKSYSMAGIDAAVLGNHAFDFPVSVLKQWVTNASYPVLCANMDFTDAELNESIKDYLILDTAGTKVGVFGIITPQLGKVTEIPEGVILYENTSAIAESVIDDLEEQGVDVIIALTHQYGDEDIELAESVAGIDLIIGGHDHLVWNETVIAPDGGKTLIVHAGKYGEETDSVDLTFSDGKVTGTSIGRYEITEDLPDDSGITSFVMPYYVNYTAGLSGPIGETLVPLDATENIKTGETNLGDLVTGIMREDVPGVDIAFINSGSFRGDCIIPAGNISYLTLETLLPFEDIIIKIRMTGQEIKDTLERSASALVAAGDESDSESRVPSGGFLQVSGVRFDLNTSGEPFSADFDTGTVLYAGNRIENLTFVTESGLVPVDPDAVYVVAVNDYIAGGGDGYSNLKDIPNDRKTNTEINLINLLATDIEENSPISPGTDGRIRVF